MTDQKRGGKTKYRLPQSWRRAVAVLLLLTVLISGICTRYFSFVSRTFYQESTSHLSEILHKSEYAEPSGQPQPDAAASVE